MKRITFIFLMSVLGLGGCGTSVDNPSFPITSNIATQDLLAMAAHPKPLRHPIVIVGGYLDLGFGPQATADRLERITDHPQIITVSLFWCGNFDDCRQKILESVDEAFPSNDPKWTTEVDVIGLSMGGLAARYAAAPVAVDPAAPSVVARRLKICRLFTLGTPHRGAVLADFPAIATLHRQMRKGSAFLALLDRLDIGQTYPIIPYVRVPDHHVGEQNAAPEGMTPHWLPNSPLEDGHLALPTDPRILADIARRLRDEPSYATEPAAPLPG